MVFAAICLPSDASSKKDFINKIYIAKKEAAETKYWLMLVAKLANSTTELDQLIDTAQNFTMMLQKIVNTSRVVHGES